MFRRLGWSMLALLFCQAGAVRPAAAEAFALAPQQQSSNEYVEIHFLDVGQGDAAVIRSPEGKVALVDAGRGGSVLAALAALGIESIDIVIASHAHADHIGGLQRVITSVPVRYYMDNGEPHTTATYMNLMRTLEASEITYLEATERTIELGSVKLRVLPPPGWSDHNNNSVGLVVEYGEFKALFTGDSEAGELQYFLSRGVPDVTVLKAPHHGSRNGVTPAWLDTTRPEVVVISCGLNNQYGHPHEWALRYYEAVHAEVFRTDLDGNVTVRAVAKGSFDVVTGHGRYVHARAQGARQPVSESTSRGMEDVALQIRVNADAPGNDHYNLNGEYVTIGNQRAETMALAGWTLCDAASHCYRFPPGAEIAGGGSVTVFTGHGTDDGTHFFMNRGRAVWNNGGDVATLWDAAGKVVGTYAY